MKYEYIALAVVIFILFLFTHLSDKEFNKRSDACQAKGGIVLKSSDGHVCVQANVIK